MGIFTRVRDIVNSNINTALDKAENPEKLVKHMIREMEDTLVEIKAACAGAMAAKKKVERDVNTANLQAAHWTTRATLAVDKKRDTLAREALLEKRRHMDEAERIQHELDELDILVDQYKGDIVQIEDKLATARERQRLLVQRHIRAVQKHRAQREIRKLDTSSAFVKFDEFENRLDRAEAEADLVNFGRPSKGSLDDQFASIEKDDAIEAELAQLIEERREHPVAVSA
jgi:phage shock protein A